MFRWHCHVVCTVGEGFPVRRVKLGQVQSTWPRNIRTITLRVYRLPRHTSDTAGCRFAGLFWTKKTDSVALCIDRIYFYGRLLASVYNGTVELGLIIEPRASG